MSTSVGRFPDPHAEARFRAAYAAVMATLPPPLATAEIATAFGRVHVHRFGDDGRTPLVLLPGRAGSTTMWLPNLPAWAARRTVYAVEVLGEAGLSVQEQPIRDAADQASWLAATLRGLGLERVHLVGVSFGGWLAVDLALHDATRVASLSLIAGRSVIHDARKAYARTRLVPDVTAELWPEATHAISGEYAERVNARVLEFVDGLDGEEDVAP